MYFQFLGCNSNERLSQPAPETVVDKFNIILTNEDLHRLQDKEELNDQVTQLHSNLQCYSEMADNWISRKICTLQ